MSYWQENIQIGNQSYPRFIGGPLDGITDSPFRKLVRHFSQKELLFTEMRHVACVAHDKSGLRALHFFQNERPLNFQIAASTEKDIENACAKIMEKGVDLVDLNVGCPAKNVIKSGSGSALMADLPRLKQVLTRMRETLRVPFTVKIRAGFKQKNACDVAKLIEDCGAAALTIHPRLRDEMFAGRPDYALAAAVKKSISIPVILSGNVINWATAKMAYEQTGVDGFLIGRGLWSKPWKLHELSLHSQGLPFQVDSSTIFAYARQHLELLESYYGSHGLYCFRKHLPFYLRGVPDATTIRNNLVMSDSSAYVKEQLEALGAQRF
jgi:tRNA-dihydrouridine synthase B